MASDKKNVKDSRDLPYYLPHLEQIKDPLRKVLEEYSGVPPDEVLSHLSRIRERAWDVHPYPCIGQWRFADLTLSLHPRYPEVLQRLTAGQTLLDLGCCLGQDIRKLICNGIPAARLYGAELRPAFIDLGFALFRDQDRLASNFFTADLFDAASRLAELKGKVDIVYAGSFFHLFGWDEQVEAGKKVAELLRPQKGSLLLGRQSGTLKPGSYPHATNKSGEMYRHDSATFARLWQQIGEATGSAWKVDAELVRREDDTDPHFGDAKNRRRLIFAVERL